MAEPWRFYGRQTELAELGSFMDSAPRFAMLAVRGRRKVGKTELANHFFAQRPADPGRPVVMLNLEVSGDVSNYYDDLREEALRAAPRLLDGFEPRENAPAKNFSRLVEHLLEQGATVVLDEFQRITPPPGEDPRLHLPGRFQSLMDRQRGLSRPPGKGERPRLIVLGSEQQKLMALFDEGQPLFAQRRTEILVRPWTFSELVEAVAGQGWDAHPDRLLTLWTAYGGMPSHWHRFAEETPELADFGREMEDGAWTDAFLASEERHRQTLDGGFARQMEVQLRPADRALLAWLAEKESGREVSGLRDPDDPRGQRILEGLAVALRQLHPEAVDHVVACEEAGARREGREPDPDRAVERAGLREALEGRLSGEHLGLVERCPAADDSRTERWHVADEHARFQLEVLEGTEKDAAHARLTSEEPVAALRRARMQRAEGRGLETLAKAGLTRLFRDGGGVVAPDQLRRTDLSRSDWRKAPKVAEIDLLTVERRPDGDETLPGRLWFGFAKRNPDGHNLVRNSTHAERWLAPAPHDERADARMARLRSWERAMLLVSPVLGEDDLARLAHRAVQACRDEDAPARAIDSWYAMDIADLLAGSGPVPLARAEPKAPETDRKDNDGGGDGSGGGMSGGP